MIPRCIPFVFAASVALGWAHPAAAETTNRETHAAVGPQTRHGGYGAPETKVTILTGDAAVLAGAQGGWIVDGRIVVGAAVYGLVSTHTPNAALWRPSGDSTIELGYGGLRVSYVLRPENAVHFTFSAIVGGGGLSIATTKNTLRTSGLESHDKAGFIALEPEIGVEANVGPYLRLALGASYRYLGDTVLPGLRSSDLSGPSAALSIKIGLF